jgi:hypothetical protein
MVFQLRGCAPRGIVRDSRQQTGRALAPVKSGQVTLRETVVDQPGLTVVEARPMTTEFRVVIETKRCRLSASHPLCRDARSVEHIDNGAYEIVATERVINRILNGANVIRWHEVTHRGQGPSLQQSRPYHRR